MIKNKHTFVLGIFILLIWLFFGIPSSAKIFLTICGAVYLIIISIKVTLPKKGVLKRVKKKEKSTPIFVENSPILPPPVEPQNIRENKEEDQAV